MGEVITKYKWILLHLMTFFQENVKILSSNIRVLAGFSSKTHSKGSRISKENSRE
jgi:hypothetical protein